MMGNWILIILVIMPGVWTGDWSVTFKDQCALKGSSVFIKCKYDYPFGNIVTSVLWSKVQLVSGVRRLYSLDSLPVPRDHFKYQGNYRGDCSLQVNNVQPSDEGQYYFTFVTTLSRWTSKTSTYLSVRELTTVVEPSTVTEGNKVRLTCVTGCPEPTNIMWFKDGRPVSKSDFLASREDAGKYYCAVYGQGTVQSAPVALNVQYPPEKVSLSVSLSGDILQGDTVTLHCSSDANPPVRQSGYRLYKDGQVISSGTTYTISDVQPSDDGYYYCQAWNNVSWRGSDRINSTEFHLNVQHRPMNVSISVDPLQVSEGSAVNLTCNSAANPPVHNYTWYKLTASSSSDNSSMTQVGCGQVLSVPSMEASHVGLYVCRVRNVWGDSSSPELLLDVMRRDGLQPVSILAGIGVSLFVTLLIALLLFWRKRKNDADKQYTVSDMKPSESSSSATEDPSNALYANIHTSTSSPTIKSQRNSHFDAAAFYEDEVTYSTVSIKTRNSNLPRYKPQESRCSAEKSDDSVIYATVVKSG